MATKEIQVKVFDRQTKEGKKFKAFKAVQKNGTFIDLKFRKEVVPPTKDCIIVVEETKMNVDNNRLYPCLWVVAIEEIKDKKSGRTVDPKISEMFD